MLATVEFGDERLEFEMPTERIVGVWRGPAAVPSAEVKGLVRQALEQPLDFPPLRQAVVPGDRVVIPVDPVLPEARAVLEALVETLGTAGVEPGSIQVLATGLPPSAWNGSLPSGVTFQVHDPADRPQLAYLASTAHGRRIYLNRTLTDADCVVPVGRLGYDPILGYRGPWSVVFPGLGDAEAQREYRAQASGERPERDHVRAALAESSDVGWLLGSQFQVGLVEGVGGLRRAVAGLDSAVRDAGMEAVDAAWSYRPARRAELVVVGIGRPGEPAPLEELVEGLATAARLVHRGGKIVALSRVQGPLGPALRRLAEAGDRRPHARSLRGLEGEADYPAARQLAEVLDWADVYLLSALAEDDVDNLAMVALAEPKEACRLAARSASCLFVSQADRTRAEMAEDGD